jgi:hypothetical protein
MKVHKNELVRLNSTSPEVEKNQPITLKDGPKGRIENISKLISSPQDFHWQAIIWEHTSWIKTIPEYA